MLKIVFSTNSEVVVSMVIERAEETEEIFPAISAALAVMSIYIDVFNMNKNIFLNFTTPEGRGDFSNVKIGNKFYENNSKGIDTVEFFISTNPGEDVKPLSYVASGGEVSRIMLAIKTVFQINIHSFIYHYPQIRFDRKMNPKIS